jgi:hypothetical protein
MSDLSDLLIDLLSSKLFGAILLFILGILLSVGVFVPRIRGTMSWDENNDVPMSPFGLAALALLAFAGALVMASIHFHMDSVRDLSTGILVCAFGVVLLAALIDFLSRRP